MADGAEEATNRYPSPTFPTHNIAPPQYSAGYNFPFDGVDIAHRLDAIGQGKILTLQELIPLPIQVLPMTISIFPTSNSAFIPMTTMLILK